jgi:hypothetical protein
MRYLVLEQEHPLRTRFYGYWTLFALSNSSEPLHLEAIYRRVHADLRHNNLLREGDELDYWVRWALSNAQKKGHVKNTAPAEGEWQITEKGRYWLELVTSGPQEDIESNI